MKELTQTEIPHVSGGLVPEGIGVTIAFMGGLSGAALTRGHSVGYLGSVLGTMVGTMAWILGDGQGSRILRLGPVPFAIGTTGVSGFLGYLLGKNLFTPNLED